MGWGPISEEEIQRVVLSTLAHRFAMALTIDELISGKSFEFNNSPKCGYKRLSIAQLLCCLVINIGTSQSGFAPQP